MLYVKYNPSASTKAKNNVSIFVYLFTFAFPSSPPSLIALSREGITIPSNCITIDAVMYGVIVIANTDNFENAPPEIISINPDIDVAALFFIVSRAIASTPGTVI